jgi:hypothetical protein
MPSEPPANMCSMHAVTVKRAALDLIARGVNDCEISRPARQEALAADRARAVASLGLHPRRYRRYVRLYRREDVARLVEEFGTKS